MRYRLKGKSLYSPGKNGVRTTLFVPTATVRRLDRLTRSMRCSRSNAVAYLVDAFADDVIKSGVRRDPATGLLIER